MGKEIDAKSVSYQDFFIEASAAQLIPAFQRPYTWSKTQILRLWKDIIEDEKSSYYIGSVVAVSGSTSAKRDEIIDGQQRLTTLSLMLIAIRDYLPKTDECSPIKEEIDGMLFRFRASLKDPEPRLSFFNKNANEAYQRLLASSSGQNQARAQAVFSSNLRILASEVAEYVSGHAVQEIKALLTRIKNLQIVFIECQNKAAAYKLFESINARSLSLASADLIKNKILFLASRKSEGALSEAEKSWRDVELAFSEDPSDIKTFIRHHWISLGRYTSHSKLFGDFEKYLREKGDFSEYLENLLLSSRVYSCLRAANVETLDKLPRRRFHVREVKDSLQFLTYLDVDQVYPVLLYLYLKDPESFRKDLNKLVAFQLLYKYIPGSPSEPEKKYFAAFPAGKIKKQEMFEGLRALVCDKAETFARGLVQRMKYREKKSGDVQFILERYVISSGKGDSFSKPTIEHIISQFAGRIASPKVGASKKKKKVRGFINSLGNLTILEKRENEELENKPVAEKIPHYEKNIFLANQEISRYPFIDDPERAVDQRSLVIAKSIYEIALRVLSEGEWPVAGKQEDSIEKK